MKVVLDHHLQGCQLLVNQGEGRHLLVDHEVQLLEFSEKLWIESV